MCVSADWPEETDGGIFWLASVHILEDLKIRTASPIQLKENKTAATEKQPIIIDESADWLISKLT